MKVAIIGVGTVGRAAASALLQRGTGVEIVLINRRSELARSVALDLNHGRPVSRWGLVKAGTYDDVKGASLVIITAEINEKAGGATDRNDPEGRLKLLDLNVSVIEDIMGKIMQVAPDAVILVVTNPPDPLADIVRERAGHNRVMSSGTFLDSVRFRTQLGQELGASPQDVSANVLGEHGTSAVLHWSAVTVGGVPPAEALHYAGKTLDQVRPRVEQAVREANLNIIEGLGASQYGIGAVIARLTEAVLRDERMVAPVGSWQKQKLTSPCPASSARTEWRLCSSLILTRRNTRLCRRASRRCGCSGAGEGGPALNSLAKFHPATRLSTSPYHPPHLGAGNAEVRRVRLP
jgi:L-lactate dehydrogenase